MQFTVTIDSGTVATAAGKDPSAVDHWLSNQAGTLEQEIVTHLADTAKSADPALADAPPPDAAAGAGAAPGAVTNTPGPPTVPLATLEAALDALGPYARAQVLANLQSQGVPVTGGGSPV